MSPKFVSVTCPCCQAEIEVDSLSGKAISWRSAQDAAAPRKPAGERWDELHSQVKGRVSESEQKLGAAFEREKTKAVDLDRLFDEANRKVKSRRPADEDAT